MDEVAIKVDHVSKSFKLPHEKNSSIKSAIVNFYRRKRSYETQQVLQDASFEIKKGEFFGIVGRNGSGKSTMLKMLAGIYTPSSGGIQINGKLTPFIELGVGFNPELTGRENVYLNGALLGFSRKEMSAMYDDIVSFAEIDKFMDQKLKNYSSGMQVRLAFSIAIRARSDILLIDEVLAVGDAAFQQKCYEYFDRLKAEKRTIVLVTHDMSAVKQFCDRALFIENGKVQTIGEPEDVSRKYERANYNKPSSSSSVEETSAHEDRLELEFYDQHGKKAEKFEYDDTVTFKISWKPELDVRMAGVVIYKGTEVVYACNSVGQDAKIENNQATVDVKLKLGDGRYKAICAVFGRNTRITLASTDLQTFVMYSQPSHGDHADEWQGVTYLENNWRQ